MYLKSLRNFNNYIKSTSNSYILQKKIYQRTKNKLYCKPTEKVYTLTLLNT